MLRWTGNLHPHSHQVLSLRRISSDPKHYLRYARCAFHAAQSHMPSAALTCARAMCLQAGDLVFVAAGGALARGAAARRASLRHDHFWASCNLRCLSAEKSCVWRGQLCVL